MAKIQGFVEFRLSSQRFDFIICPLYVFSNKIFYFISISTTYFYLKKAEKTFHVMAGTSGVLRLYNYHSSYDIFKNSNSKPFQKPYLYNIFVMIFISSFFKNNSMYQELPPYQELYYRKLFSI